MIEQRKSFWDGLGRPFWEDETLYDPMRVKLGLVCFGDGPGGGDGDSTSDKKDTKDTKNTTEEDGPPGSGLGPNDVATNTNSQQASMEANAQAAAEQAARDAGYTPGVDHGVRSSSGNPVTSSDGTPVSSSGFNDAMESGYNESMRSQIQEQRDREYKAAQMNAAKTGNTKSDRMMSIAHGVNPDDFTGTPPTAEEVAAARAALGMAAAQDVGNMGFSVGFSNQPGDMLGTFGGPTTSDFGTTSAGSNMLGSDLDARNQAFGQFQSGFNDEAGFFGTQLTDIETGPYAGTVGFTNFGQRVANTVGPGVVGLVASSINPVLGLAANGLQSTTMMPYGSQVASQNNPYASTGTQYNSFSADNALSQGITGALMGSLMQNTGVGRTVGREAGKLGYSVGKDVGNALGSDLAGQMVGQTVAGQALGAVTSPVSGAISSTLGSISTGLPSISGTSEMPSPVELAAEDELGGSGGDSGTQPSNIFSSNTTVIPSAPRGNAPQDNTMSSSLENIGGDITNPQNPIYQYASTATEPNADYLGEAITGTPAGVTTSQGDYIANPIMGADPATGVQYLTRGRDRTYGSGTTTNISRNDFLRNDRRARVTGSFGNRALRGNAPVFG